MVVISLPRSIAPENVAHIHLSGILPYSIFYPCTNLKCFFSVFSVLAVDLELFARTSFTD